MTLNGYGEIRAFTLTLNKAHDQYMPGLALIPGSCRQFGHPLPQFVFTDNVRSNKAELERILPSLREGVHSVPSSPVYPVLEIPTSWTVFRLNSEYSIRLQVQHILDDLKPSETAELVVGIDVEWSSDRTTGIYGTVSMLSIVYRSKILLIQVCFQHLEDLLVLNICLSS